MHRRVGVLLFRSVRGHQIQQQKVRRKQESGNREILCAWSWFSVADFPYRQTHERKKKAWISTPFFSDFALLQPQDSIKWWCNKYIRDGYTHPSPQECLAIYYVKPDRMFSFRWLRVDLTSDERGATTVGRFRCACLNGQGTTFGSVVDFWAVQYLYVENIVFGPSGETGGSVVATLFFSVPPR